MDEMLKIKIYSKERNNYLVYNIVLILTFETTTILK